MSANRAFFRTFVCLCLWKILQPYLCLFAHHDRFEVCPFVYCDPLCHTSLVYARYDDIPQNHAPGQIRPCAPHYTVCCLPRSGRPVSEQNHHHRRHGSSGPVSFHITIRLFTEWRPTQIDKRAIGWSSGDAQVRQRR